MTAEAVRSLCLSKELGFYNRGHSRTSGDRSFTVHRLAPLPLQVRLVFRLWPQVQCAVVEIENRTVNAEVLRAEEPCRFRFAHVPEQLRVEAGNGDARVFDEKGADLEFRELTDPNRSRFGAESSHVRIGSVTANARLAGEFLVEHSEESASV